MTRSKVSSYSKIDPAHLLDGLWVPRARKGEALYDVRGEFDGGWIAFKGVQLDARHQSVLLAIAARTARAKAKGTDALLIKGSGGDLLARQRSMLQLTGAADDMDFTTVETSAYALLVDAGIEPNKAGYRKLKELLGDLASVTVVRDVDGVGGTSRMISFKWNNDSIHVSLNWRMSDAILGGQNIQISLMERHSLPAQSWCAHILHAWLSGFVRRGGHLMAGRGASIDALVRHVYGNRPASEDIHRQRRKSIRKALGEIGMLKGWAVRMEGDRVFVSRPKELCDGAWTMGEAAAADELICQSAMEGGG